MTFLAGSVLLKPTIVFAHVRLSILPSVRASVRNKHFSSWLSVTTLWKILKFGMLIATMMQGMTLTFHPRIRDIRGNEQKKFPAGKNHGISFL